MLSKKRNQAFPSSRRQKASQDELAVLTREVARLEEENEILKKCGSVLRAGAAVRYAWIDAQRGHRVRTLCAALNVSTSGY